MWSRRPIANITMIFDSMVAIQVAAVFAPREGEVAQTSIISISACIIGCRIIIAISTHRIGTGDVNALGEISEGAAAVVFVACAVITSLSLCRSSILQSVFRCV